MTPVAYTWPYVALFVAAMLWAFLPESRIVRRARRDATATDAKSLQLITTGMGLAVLGSFLLALVPRLQFTSHRVGWFFFGLAMLVAGSLLRRHCWRMLGTSFTGDVRAHAGQEVVTRGAYRILRHPSYTAGIVMNTAIGLALGNWGSAVLLGVSSFFVYRYRIVVEERALLAAIGEPYRLFASTRKRLIPFVY